MLQQILEEHLIEAVEGVDLLVVEAMEVIKCLVANIIEGSILKFALAPHQIEQEVMSARHL